MTLAKRLQRNVTTGSAGTSQLNVDSRNRITGALANCTAANAYCYDAAGDLLTPRSDLPRDKAGNYQPNPNAQGAHTVIGTRVGGDGVPYRQGATFDENGNFAARTDVTDHGRADHANPHFHPATGPNSVKPGPGEPVH